MKKKKDVSYNDSFGDSLCLRDKAFVTMVAVVAAAKRSAPFVHVLI